MEINANNYYKKILRLVNPTSSLRKKMRLWLSPYSIKPLNFISINPNSSITGAWLLSKVVIYAKVCPPPLPEKLNLSARAENVQENTRLKATNVCFIRQTIPFVLLASFGSG